MNCDSCADAGCKFCDGSVVTGDDIVREFEKFLCTVNKVTAYHRHGQGISKRSLDALSNEQIDMESLIGRYKERN